MHGQMSPRSDQRHALDHCLIVEGARLGGDGDARLRRRCGDRGDDPFLDAAGLLDSQRPRHADRRLADHFGADAAQPQRLERNDARRADNRLFEPRRKIGRRRIEQRADRAPAEPEAGDGDKGGDPEGRERVAPYESEMRGDEADEHEYRGDQVAGEMQCVRRERVAMLLCGDG